MMVYNTGSIGKRTMLPIKGIYDHEQEIPWEQSECHENINNTNDLCNGDVGVYHFDREEEQYYCDHNESNIRTDPYSWEVETHRSTVMPSLASSECSTTSSFMGESKYNTVRYDERLIGVQLIKHEENLRRTVCQAQYNENLLLKESFRFRQEKLKREQQRVRYLEGRGRGQLPSSDLPETIDIALCPSSSLNDTQGMNGSSSVFEQIFTKYHRGNGGNLNSEDKDDDGFILGMELLMTTLVILVVVVAIVMGLNGPSDDERANA